MMTRSYEQARSALRAFRLRRYSARRAPSRYVSPGTGQSPIISRDHRFMGTTRAEMQDEFRRTVKAHNCPACGAAFTDYAVDWGWGWFHGYRDRLAEEEVNMRDG